MPPDLHAEARIRRLPLESTGFVGRQAELSTLGTLLEESRLVTVTGPGGVGKTRLALRYAAREGRRYADGVVLAELSGLRDPDLLPLTVASAVGLSQLDGRSPLAALADFLPGREMLLILDTCEHLVDACALLAEELIRAAPGVTILATSRQPLDISGESTCPLAPLLVPRPGSAPGAGDAVELFAQRAGTAVAGFRVTAENRDQVIRVCERLDGIPLAIELAAVRLRALDLAQLTRQLGQRLSLLSGGRGGVPRHQALRDTIGWSYDLCSGAEQTLWARLSAFAGPFTAEAAEEVCAGGGLPREDVLGTLISLVDKSVLSHCDGPVPCYRMLDTIREYGAERLERTGAAGQVRARLAAHYRRLLEEFDRDPVTAQLDRYRTLRAQHENIRAAFRYAFALPRQEPEEVRLGTSLYWYVLIAGELNEARYWLSRFLERAAGPSAERAHALLVDGLIATAQGDSGPGLAKCEEGLAMASGLGASRVRARGYFFYCEALVAADRPEEALAAGDTARKLLAETGDTATAEALRLYTGLALLLTGDLDGCYDEYAEGLRRIPPDAGERWISSFLSLLAAFVLALRGDHEPAEAAARRALAMRQDLGDPMGIGYCLGMLAFAALQQGRHQQAAWLVGSAFPVWENLGTAPFTGVPALADIADGAEAAIRAALGDDTWDTIVGQAAACPPEEAALVAGSPSKLARVAADPSPLTAREREIAGLVAQALSSRHIAERLFISKRTVDSHIEHIYGKLGLSSRVQLAAWVHEQPGS